jgi:hypothetical protein
VNAGSQAIRLTSLRWGIDFIDAQNQVAKTGKQLSDSTVIAVSGRRIDAPNRYPARFPLANIASVRKRIAAVLRSEHVIALVSSAACGADILSLQEAAKLGIRRRIVLPFAAQRFRRTSVSDCPGDWGDEYDRLIAEARAVGDLLVLHKALSHDDDAAYSAVNNAIISEAESLAVTLPGRPHRLLPVIIWEGSARPEADRTGEFRKIAAKAGFEPARTILSI